MFGSKLRAWMEAVRPKKKQHRREKQGKSALSNSGPNTNSHTVTWKNTSLLDSDKKVKDDEVATKFGKTKNEATVTSESQLSRYSTTNLSSPESAYSTGYSTDGTSPGAPPDYLLKPNKKDSQRLDNCLNVETCSPRNINCLAKQDQFIRASPCIGEKKITIPKTKECLEEKDTSIINSSTIFYGKITDTSGLVSPRQRNRIRTNPWLPGGTNSAAPSPLPVRQEMKQTPVALRNFRNSPIQNRYLSPVANRRSLSSSSCSSLSAGNHSFDPHFPRSLSDEDDCTLNEMMGKYDESYVYEKETDILSDSDPTDCESDIDTGQDGGDEDDNADVELDYIDNGSYIELDYKADNTGHCSYFIPPDIQRKRSSRRRTTRRNKESNERKRRSSTSKKINHRLSSERTRPSSLHKDGSKSAGATPISVRRSSLRPNYRAQEECLKKRSNSVSLNRDPTILIDKRDREADMKYKELIGQAEQIIRTMNINGLSPRRIPGPTNKRVELLRTTECGKSEALFKNKPTEETLVINSNIPPSNNLFKNNRFSPKKNHITNFIINNSPVLVRKELQGQSPLTMRRNLTEDVNYSPILNRKQKQIHEDLYKKHSDNLTIIKKTMREHHEVSFDTRKSYQPKSILHKSEFNHMSILSPRHRRHIEPAIESSSSDEEACHISRKKLSKSCPQSEPVRRKVYFGRSTIGFSKGHEKTVAFNLTNEMPNLSLENNIGSSDNLRHQILLNTIQSLKRNLEDQSASLQQSYRNTHHMYKY